MNLNEFKKEFKKEIKKNIFTRDRIILIIFISILLIVGICKAIEIIK